SPLTIVEESRKRIRKISDKSNDVLFTVIYRSLDAMTLILQPSSDSNKIQRALATLEFERKQTMEDDEERAIDLRNSIYDLIHCLQVTLQELTKNKGQP
ncbi:hypothetical protein PFISCL1PPCAC_23030, partial [Pristionchus fissidentatus]